MDLSSLHDAGPACCGWIELSIFSAAGEAIEGHVIPLGDFRDHEDSDECWCRPDVSFEPRCSMPIVVHNSMDGREAFERGERKMS